MNEYMHVFHKARGGCARRRRFLAALLALFVMGAASVARAMEIPDSIKKIEAGAFQGDSALTLVEIPDSMVSIGAGAFADCANLKEIIVYGDNVAFGANALGRAGETRLIRGPLNSTAQTYAKTYGFEFISFPNPAAELVERAEMGLGLPYSQYDCVMFVYYTYYYALNMRIESSCSRICNSTQSVRINSISELAAGDVICWKSDGDSDRCTHVGMYIGAGTVGGRTYSSGVFIESSQGYGKVRYNYLPPTGTSWYTRNFLCARRYI